MTKVLAESIKEKIKERGSNVFYIPSCGKCDEYKEIIKRNYSVSNPQEKKAEKPDYDFSNVRLPYKN
jgi:hypothetical protein